MRIKNCRICHYPLSQIISFGNMPIVNYYLSKEELEKPEKKYELNFCICTNCTLGQLDELIPPEEIFVNYHYASSVSQPLVEHLEKLADLCVKKFLKTPNAVFKALDIGCNDGVLLARLKQHGMQTLGIDPAKNIITKLQELEIPSIADFFSRKLAQNLVKDKKFDLIFATNTLAQVIDVDDFVRGIKMILKDNGIFIVEVGYLLDMIKKKTFDSIYHEHYSYFSLQSLNYLFNKHELKIFDSQHISNHGGSLRLFITHKENIKRKKTKTFEKLLEKEKKNQLHTIASYKEFSEYFTNFKKSFRGKLLSLKGKNKTIVGVGSPAKSVILLNYCEIDTKILDYIVDSTPYKQYRFMPGTHIPILPENELEKQKADYFLLLAWTYKNELLKKLEKYRKERAKVIIPLPKIKII